MDAAPAGDRKHRRKASGGSISPLEVHADFLLSLIARRPDLTLDEIVVAMRKRWIAGSRSAVSALGCAMPKTHSGTLVQSIPQRAA
jgi:hypothetical protein